MSKKKNQTQNQVQAQVACTEAISLQLEGSDLPEGQLAQKLVQSYIKELLINQTVSLNQIFGFNLQGKKTQFKAIKIEPIIDDKVLVTKKTCVDIVNSQKQISNKQSNVKLYGLDSLFEEIKQVIEQSLGDQANFIKQNGFQTMKGLLIIGQSGTGKSEILNQINYPNKYLIRMNECDQFEWTLDKGLSHKLILIDDLQLIKESGIKYLQRIFDQQDDLLIIGTINNTKNLDEALKRVGRFEREINIELPNHQKRVDLIHQTIQDHLTLEQIKEISYQMSGFTVGDIRALLRSFICQETKTKIKLQELLRKLNPIGLKDLVAEVPQVKWEDIGGYEDVKDEIKRVIEWPLKYGDSFKKLGVETSKGILLYGPPGCSKTLLARALCTQCNLSFIAVKGPEIFSKYVGDSEKAVRDIFKKARVCAPSVVFFDEIDSIAPQRSGTTDVADRVLIQLLTEMDGFESLKNVIVIGATNRPSSIDKALLRPGRFDHLIFIDLPDEQARKGIFEVNLKKMKVDKSILDKIDELAGKTQFYTGAEITQICRQAGLLALKRNLQAELIEWEDIISSLNQIKPSMTQLDRQQFIQFEQKRQS